MRFSLVMRAFVESTARRTTIHVASFDTLAEATEFLTRMGPDELQPGETMTIECEEEGR
jgi:hypothetical protein